MIGDFLKPPTDNLYKFMCISGLILMILSVAFPAWRLNNHVRSYYENLRDFEMLKVDLEQTKHKSDLLTAESDALTKERGELTQELDKTAEAVSARTPLTRTERETLANDVNRLKEVKAKLDAKSQQLIEKALARTETAVTERKKLVEIRYKTEAALWDSRTGLAMCIIALATGLIGFWFFRKGFNFWSTRVQVYQDAILKKQAEDEGAQPSSSKG